VTGWPCPVGYKSYVVILNQSGGHILTTTEVLNQFGLNATWVKNNTGTYLLTFPSSIFTPNKTIVIVGVGDYPGNVIFQYNKLFTDDKTLYLTIYNGTTATDDLLKDFPLEIRVYN